MRKTIPFVLMGILAASTAMAEEMVIRLQSGNAVVVRYEGTIHGVELQGKSDAIAGLDLPAAAQEPIDNRQALVAQQKPWNQPEKNKADDQEGKWLRLRWADPVDETR